MRRCHLNGKNTGADKQREIGGKVAEIEFFEVGNHAGNGHLSADKVTKCSDKVFILKKTLTLPAVSQAGFGLLGQAIEKSPGGFCCRGLFLRPGGELAGQIVTGGSCCCGERRAANQRGVRGSCFFCGARNIIMKKSKETIDKRRFRLL